MMHGQNHIKIIVINVDCEVTFSSLRAFESWKAFAQFDNPAKLSLGIPRLYKLSNPIQCFKKSPAFTWHIDV